eukprot:1254255-Rhodomonas_salina.2
MAAAESPLWTCMRALRQTVTRVLGEQHSSGAGETHEDAEQEGGAGEKKGGRERRERRREKRGEKEGLTRREEEGCRGMGPSGGRKEEASPVVHLPPPHTLSVPHIAERLPRPQTSGPTSMP